MKKKKKNIPYLLLILLLFSLSCSKEKAGEKAPELEKASPEGIVYVQGDGDHTVVLDLKSGLVKRIVHGKDVAAVDLSADGNRLYVMNSDGYIRSLDLGSAAPSEWKKIAKGICDSSFGKDGGLWIVDSSAAELLRYDTATGEAVRKASLDKGTCGISFSNDGQTAYLTNQKNNSIALLDMKTLTKTADIPGAGNSIHLSASSPSGSELWVAEGNEYKDGKPYGIGYSKLQSHAGGLNIIDLEKKELVDFVLIGGNAVDLESSPDGKQTLVAISRMPDYDDATVVVIDPSSKRVVQLFPVCKDCHVSKGISLPGEKALVRSMSVNWQAASFPQAAR